jgi:L-ascorbate metabolism protein UlaG (beta-lactamase superfamily)
MHVEWFGQSAFALRAGGKTVVIDPFGDVSSLSQRELSWEYPPIELDGADLVLVTHEHLDHNGVEAVPGEPPVLRSTAGRLHSPIGEVVAIASEHDDEAGTRRGPNTIFALELDGLRVAHMGDFGQRELRDEQAARLENLDLLFLPVGGGPTVDAAQAAAIVGRLRPRWAVPMHYRTPRIDFLDTEEAFVEAVGEVERLERSSFETADLREADATVVVVPAAP